MSEIQYESLWGLCVKADALLKQTGETLDRLRNKGGPYEMAADLIDEMVSDQSDVIHALRQNNNEESTPKAHCPV